MTPKALETFSLTFEMIFVTSLITIVSLSFAGGELYSGTVSDFSGTDALIYRNPLRTEQYDLKHLNGKHFKHFTTSIPDPSLTELKGETAF